MPLCSSPAVLFLLAACSSGSPDATIAGQVVDHAGAPIAGVEVVVEGSAYKAATSSDGRYTITYAPGTFEVTYRKDGMTSASVKHTISTAVAYPAADIQLFPAPTEQGLYLLSPTHSIRFHQPELPDAILAPVGTASSMTCSRSDPAARSCTWVPSGSA